ncbi:carboxypeptidase-like regulatory domain-containing protein, partial [Candidatus Hydrogenedentota bacterium]
FNRVYYGSDPSANGKERTGEEETVATDGLPAQIKSGNTVDVEGTQGEGNDEESTVLASSPATENRGPSLSAKPKPASVYGRVMDGQGYLMEAASIRLEVAEDDTGYNILRVYEALTDAEGLFDIGGIDAFGMVSIYASAKGHVMQKQFLRDLSPGSNLRNINFTLASGKHFIAGYVVSDAGEPIAQATVHLRCQGYKDEQGGGSMTSLPNLAFTLSNEDGYFEIAVQGKGFADFTVTREGFGTGFFPMIHTGTTDARFVLRSGGAISGTVTLTEGGPVAGAEMLVVGQATQAGQIRTDEPAHTFLIASIAATTDEHGGYFVDGLGEDYSYTVTVEEAPGIQSTSGRPSGGWSSLYGLDALARKTNVRVAAGETTSNVNLVLGALARVYGRITDPTTDVSVYPLQVKAIIEGVEGETPASLGGATKVESDGSYELVLPISTKVRVRVTAEYIPETSKVKATRKEDEPTLELEPGVERELNFEVDAPVTVPVHVVDGDGEPLAGMWLWMKQNPGQGWAGLDTVTNAEGRYTWHSVPPITPFIVYAIEKSKAGASDVTASSQPVFGQPGETIPEVLIVCAVKGGVEGIIVDPEGDPISNERMTIRAVRDDGKGVGSVTTTTDADGRFTVLWAFPEREYARVSVRADGKSGYVENVEILRDSVTDLGTVVLDTIPETPAHEHTR